MSKEVKSRDRFYNKRAKIEFNDIWTVNGENVDALINKAIEFFNKNQLVRDRNVFSYFNVGNCIGHLHSAETFWHGDIFQSWLDVFFEAVASAIFIDAYNGTVGNEKAKYKHAEAVLAQYQKLFA